MNKKFFFQYNAYISTDNLEICFQRLFEDVRDQMSDDPRPVWEPCNEFHINVKKIHSWTTSDLHSEYVVSFNHRKVVKEMSINGDRNLANLIWKVGKHYDDFDTVVKAAMSMKSKG